jgi:hypothetical protein
MRPAGVANAPVPKGEQVFGGSDPAGEVGRTDGDALCVTDPQWIDNHNGEAGLIQRLERRTSGIDSDEDGARQLGSEQCWSADYRGIGGASSTDHDLESLGWC